ncbi:MAG: Na(+)-translocating NADH-quinone reductase subunit A [Duncaniella sp.]|nr:Na(+)-translocating NADH-quinone reductase subunit A [Duncaniella sp.]
MRKTYKLRKGLNLSLEGAVDPGTPAVSPDHISAVAMVPDDYPGFLPKLDVKEGDIVAQGAPLMHHKADEEVKLVAPAGGVVRAVVRGPRRKIERVVVEPVSEAPSAVRFEAGTPTDPAEIAGRIKASGLWAQMRRRPYDVIPFPGDRPRDIFITAMDTAPLAQNLDTLVADRKEDLDAGVKALGKLTDGKIYISVATGSTLPDIEEAEMAEFTPLHPAGNAGVQAANIAPVNKGEIIWTLDIVTLARIGALYTKGIVDTECTVAVTGPEASSPKRVRVPEGTAVKDILAGMSVTSDHHVRIISGNVLTGIPVPEDGFLRFPYRQITLIAEGDDRHEFMGWASMSPDKMSVSRAFLSKIGGRKFSPDARLNGGRRAMIMSGVYDDLVPMDIMPEYLIKAILARDIDRMEALGIYEVAPEDFALAEYADPSKLELQKIVREALDYLRGEIEA